MEAAKAVRSGAHRFVDRREQLDALRQRYRAALAGDGSLVIVASDGGAGKSRLVQEFCEGLSTEARCAVGHCLEYVQSPLAPFLSVIESLISEDPLVLKGSPSVRSMLSFLLPSIEDAPVDAAVQLRMRDKLQQFNAIAEALRRFGAAKPTVIVIEDVHWADSASLELLQHLVPHLEASRLLVVITYRSDELPRGHLLRTVAAKLERHRLTFRESLPPLAVSDMHELLFDLRQGLDVPAEIIDAICTQAEGNPLFAEELLKTVGAGGAAAEDRPLPATLREAVLTRLEAVSAADRAALVNAAAIGRRFEPEFLAQIMDVPIENVIPALKRALDLQIIVAVDEERETYAFRHALIRQALYDELLTAEARPLHRRIAVALEARSADDHVIELAYHWWRAHDADKAARYNELAGDEAAEVLAHRDALVHYERALATGALQGTHRAQLNRRFAWVLYQCGLVERAKRAMEEALKHYQETGDAELAAQVCLGLGAFELTLGDADRHLALARRALELVHADPASPAFFAAHVELLRRYAAHHWDPVKAQEHVAEAERATGERSARAAINFIEMRIAFEAFRGRPTEARSLAEQGVERATRDGDLLGAISCWSNFAAVLELAGESALAAEGFDQALALIERSGIDSLTAYWAFVELAYASLNRGDLRRARELVERLLATNVDLPTFRLHIARSGVSVGLRLELDDMVRRCSHKDLIDLTLHSSDPAIVGTAGAFAEASEVQGKSDAARSLLHGAIEMLESSKAQPPPGDVDLLLLAVAKIGDAADLPRARVILERIVRDSGVRSTPAFLAMFDAYDARRAGDRERAVAHAEAAAGKFAVVGWPLYQAEALELAGRDEQALELYRQCGDVRNARRLDAKLNPVNRRGRTKGELTAREREICALLTKAKTNRAIAEELVLSERTVESHVSSILMKMNATSRAELIAKLKSPT
jgi:DNA-binding CsgD family transcriptional regulator/tetratricopeptide (TPR) repeat protein